VFLLGVLLVVWHMLFIVQRQRAGPPTAGVQPSPVRSHAWELHIMSLIAVSFALAAILQCILAAPPHGRYMAPAGVFLPAVAVVVLFAVGTRVCAQWEGLPTARQH